MAVSVGGKGVFVAVPVGRSMIGAAVEVSCTWETAERQADRNRANTRRVTRDLFMLSSHIVSLEGCQHTEAYHTAFDAVCQHTYQAVNNIIDGVISSAIAVGYSMHGLRSGRNAL